ncbi:hypothetical protein [Arthrobacter sp. ISL-65]|uniref:hypothetical protein n=1 Tax=Arthrobacter sp. ISL-65 TaxID=2819112 RepID=UPI001BE89C6D|nr:hypothetical protein [Arthrobacter sp. ISL-65]MBT2551439.1 hypothetical protein [Arthrobacter sp. ISL-65]
MPEVNDWSMLVGRTVELRLDGRYVRTAEVEDATADDSIIWLRFDGNDGRKLISNTEGYEIRPVS